MTFYIMTAYQSNNPIFRIYPKRIKVAGVVGVVGNTVNRIIKAKLTGIDFGIMNTRAK